MSPRPVNCPNLLTVKTLMCILTRESGLKDRPPTKLLHQGDAWRWASARRRLLGLFLSIRSRGTLSASNGLERYIACIIVRGWCVSIHQSIFGFTLHSIAVSIRSLLAEMLIPKVILSIIYFPSLQRRILQVSKPFDIFPPNPSVATQTSMLSPRSQHQPRHHPP